MTSLEQNGSRTPLRLQGEWCRKCGQTIEAISPTWFTVERDLKDPKHPRGRVCYDPDKPDDPALCVACSIATVAEDRRTAWGGFLAGLIRRKELAGLPDDVTLFHHKTQNKREFRRTKRVHQTDFYFVISEEPLNCRWNVPTDSFHPDDGSPPMTMIYLGVDLRLDGVTASMSVTWNAAALGSGESEMKINRWAEASHDDVKHLMDGARWLWESEGLWRGRPPGTFDRSEDEYLSAAVLILERDGKLTKALLADHLRTDAKRVSANLKSYGYTWPSFKTEAVSRAKDARASE